MSALELEMMELSRDLYAVTRRFEVLAQNVRAAEGTRLVNLEELTSVLFFLYRDICILVFFFFFCFIDIVGLSMRVLCALPVVIRYREEFGTQVR